MTEAEWLAAVDSLPLTDWLFFDTLASVRKLRLFSVACCRPLLPYLQQFAHQTAQLLAVTEAFVDGQAPLSVLERTRETLLVQWREYDDELLRRYREHQATGTMDSFLTESAAAFFYLSQMGVNSAMYGTWFAERNQQDREFRRRDYYQGPDRRSFPFAAAAEAGEAAANAGAEMNVDRRGEAKKDQAHLLRDIFGNPFRPVTFDPAWRTETAVALAGQMYESRDFGAMPILADALQDAGCTSDDILDHCRGPGPHARGCWVVDLVLGKE